MSNGWKWVLWICGLVAVLWMCNALANSAAREDTRSAREARVWSDGLRQATTGGATPTYPATIRPTVETTMADLTVWRFCSGVIAGDLEEGQLDAVYRLNESELSKDREEKLAVVFLLRRQVERGLQGASPTSADVREMQQACQAVRRADRER